MECYVSFTYRWDSQLKSVVGDEKVFTSQEKIAALKLLENEVWNIYNDNK